MADEKHESTAADLTARWLTVEQVMGWRGGGRSGVYRGMEVVSAGEYAGGAGVPDEESSVGAQMQADEYRLGHALPAGEYPLAAAMPAEQYPPHASLSADTYQHPVLELVGGGDAEPAGRYPVPDLVAADTALASRWFTADRAPGKLAGRTVVLPFVAVAELATWPERLLWGQARTEDLSLWTDPGRILAGDATVARIWARITVAAQRAGGSASAHDAWIAAGCLSYGLPLATLNKRHYQYFADRYGLVLL